MSRFSTEVRVNATKAEVLRTGQSILEEMDMIFEDRDLSNLLFKEKYRFDPFNPVEVKVHVRENGDGTFISLEGENLGTGPYQETHVKKMVFQLMDRLEDSFGSEREPTIQDPNITRELELLQSLHSKGILTDHEYEKARMKILG